MAALLLVPLVTVFLWLGLAWLVLFPLVGHLAGGWASGVFGILYRAISGVTGTLARVPGIAVAPEAVPAWAAAAGAAVLVFALLAPRGARAEPAWVH